MLATGDRVPEGAVWTAPHVRKTIQEVLADGPALFLFYLYDWSST